MTKPDSLPSRARLDAQVCAAVEEYLARQAGTRHPDGTYILGVWLPSDEEVRPCCRHHRPTNQPYSPKAYPESARRHCVGVRHVAALFGIPVAGLRAALRNR